MNGTQILMHKNNKVAECKFDQRGYLKGVSKVFDEHLLPLNVNLNDDKTAKINMQRWILDRGLSASRRDIAPLREFYGSEAFLTDTGLSLFDCYWFANNDFRDWDKVNPYENWNCKTDSFYLMLAHPDALRAINLNSPNLTIPGRSQRIWYKSGNDLYMLYGDAQKEMSAYKKSKENDAVAKRSYVILAGKIYATTAAETDLSFERISFEELYSSVEDPNKSKMENLITCCNKYDLPNWKDFFGKMNEFDELVGNESRELSDIGVLRDTETLEFVSFCKL